MSTHHSTSPKLLPCPFCGGKAVFEISRPDKDDPIAQLLGDTYRVACGNLGCWCSGPLPHNFYGRKESAAKVWNTRSSPLPSSSFPTKSPRRKTKNHKGGL